MDKGTKVYRAYVCMDANNWWIDEGTISGIVCDGKPLVQWGTMLIPVSERWHASKSAAKADVATILAREIGRLQAKLDTLRDEILHETLTAEVV